MSKPAHGAARGPEPEPMGEVLAATQSAVDAATPELHIQRKWGSDWRVGTDLVVCVGAFTRHVGIEFWRGTTVPDPRGLLEGTGKNLRHVKIRSVAEARSPALRTLLRAAVGLDRKAEKRPATGRAASPRPGR